MPRRARPRSPWLLKSESYAERAGTFVRRPRAACAVILLIVCQGTATAALAQSASPPVVVATVPSFPETLSQGEVNYEVVPGPIELERLPQSPGMDASEPLPPSSPLGEPLREPSLGDDWDPSTTLGELGYRGAGHRRGPQWLIGNGNHMGLFTLGFSDEPKLKPFRFLPSFDFAIHFVMGPKQTDMPAQLYDLFFRWGHKGQITDDLGYDVSFTLGFYTDFEGSARKGLRWPSTAVLEYRTDESLKWLLGVDILNRDDYFCLPVFGTVWTPRPDVRVDLVFPKPRVSYRTSRLGWVFVGGEMWGGMWAIERQAGASDVVTYRDLRAVIGLESTTENQIVWFTDLGVAFNRHLEFRSGTGDYQPLATFLLQGTVIY